MQGLEGFKWCFHRIINLIQTTVSTGKHKPGRRPHPLLAYTENVQLKKEVPGNRCPPKNTPRARNLSWLMISPGREADSGDEMSANSRRAATSPVCAANGSMKQIDKTDPVALGLLLINITSAWKTVSSWVTEDWRHHPSAPSPLWLCSVWGASCECGLPVTWVRRGWCPHVTPRPLRVSRGATSVAFSARE